MAPTWGVPGLFLIVVNHVIRFHLPFLDCLCSSNFFKSMSVFCTCTIQILFSFTDLLMMDGMSKTSSNKQ